MQNNTVAMGTYYRANPYGLVRTVCRAFDQAGDAMIVYVNVGEGGCASDALIMPENEFINIFGSSRSAGVC